MVAASATFPVPSKDIAGAVTKLPVIEKSLAVSRAVAVEATPVMSPVTAPTKELAVTMPVGALIPEELIVVAEPTVNEVVIATTFGSPIVRLFPEAAVSISFAVPAIVNVSLSRSMAPVPVSPAKSKSILPIVVLSVLTSPSM